MPIVIDSNTWVVKPIITLLGNVSREKYTIIITNLYKKRRKRIEY